MYRLTAACIGIAIATAQPAADARIAPVPTDNHVIASMARCWSAGVMCWLATSPRSVCQQPVARRGGAPKADSDVDSNGRALSDEFSDCVSAYVAGKFDSTISVESVAKIVE
jgi:hypothetical protein